MRSVLSEFYLVCTIVNNLSILCIVYVLARGYFYEKVKLSIGSFKIKRKDFSVQNITNIVSMKFYNGGEVPVNVRKEILDVTCPAIKQLSINKLSKKRNRHKKRYRNSKSNNEKALSNK